jgi:hypothetical protein
MSAAHDLIHRLPELPLETFETAGTLDRSARGPFLTIRPQMPPAVEKPPVPAHAPSKSSFSTRKYYTQALYPRVICYDPGDLVVGLTMNIEPQPFPGRDRPPTDVAALAGQERFYKLSALRSVPFRHPLWCSVKYGPWLAVATETESCLDGVPTRWEFFVVEIPEVALLWFGEWEDMPAFPSLTVIMGNLALAGHQTSCCPGFQWCPTTQSCIPLQVNCQDPIPI